MRVPLPGAIRRQARADRRPEVAVRAALAMAPAFIDDPLFVAAFADPIARATGLPLAWYSIAHQAGRTGRVDLADRDGLSVGAALWLPGTAAEFGWAEVVADGYLRFGLTAGVPDALRLMRMQAQMSRQHQRLAPGRHQYLAGLGVLPQAQRRGAGSELLRRGLARTDAAGEGVYLETHLPHNAALYRRHGFQTLDQRDNFGFHTWSMWHPAQG